jgi:glycosyltransferase involved in cell wall biosynthesis
MMETPTVSVIITFWNRADYLAEAVEGVLAQALPPGMTSELVMIDDGSEDDSAAVAQRFAPAARIVRQENRGSGGSANRGVQEARGEYLAFCDSDDVWLPGKLDAQLTAIAEGDVDIVFVHVEEFLSPELDPEVVRTRPLRDAMPGYIPSSVLLRRSCFDEIGLIDESLENGAWVDWYMRAKTAGLREVVLDEVFVQRRIHGANNWAAQHQSGAGYLRALRSWVHSQRDSTSEPA